jgi:hypothetical protein
MELELVTTPAAGPTEGVVFSARMDLGKYGWADLERGVVLPKRFVANFAVEDDHTVEMLITAAEGEAPICETIKINRPAGLTGKRLRQIPVDEWVRFACSRIGIGNQGGERTTDAEWESEQYRADVGQVVGRAVRGNRRRNVTTDDFLQRVAQTYRENADSNPIKKVMEAYRVSEGSARRYVSLCRQRGFLPPTTRGKVTI